MDWYVYLIIGIIGLIAVVTLGRAIWLAIVKIKKQTKTPKGRKSPNYPIEVEKSFIASILIWWRLVFLALSVFLIVYVLMDYNVYMTGLDKYIETMKGEKTPVEIVIKQKDEEGQYIKDENGEFVVETETITSLEDYIETIHVPFFPEKSVYNAEDDLGIAQMLVSMTNVETATKTLKWVNDTFTINLSLKELMDNISNLIFSVGAGILIVWMWSFNRTLTRNRKTSYTFNQNILMITSYEDKKHKKEVNQVTINPGCYVSVKQTLKGKIFKYGDIRLHLGLGESGDVVLTNVKKPYKAARQLELKMEEECLYGSSSSRAPFVMMSGMFGNTNKSDKTNYTRVL